MLRGYVKSNSQYTLINSKTRNGTFGLKGWISSHNFIVNKRILWIKEYSLIYILLIDNNLEISWCVLDLYQMLDLYLKYFYKSILYSNLKL
jgi:hypothetical protein